MYSGLKLLAAIVSLPLALTLLSACTESSSSPADSSYTISYLDRGLSYPVELLVGGKVERLIPGQAFETSVEGGGKLQVSIQSHSPLVQCGFRDKGDTEISLEADSGRHAVLDCEFVDFLESVSLNSSTNAVERKTFVYDGFPDSTRQFLPDGNGFPLGRFGNNLLFRTEDQSGFQYLWSDADTLTLRQTAWSNEVPRAVALGDDEIFLLYADDSGQGELRVSQSMVSAETPLLVLPALEGNLRYNDLGIRDGQIVISTWGSVDENSVVQFFLVSPDQPQEILGPLSTQGELTRFYGDIRSGVFVTEYDRETQEGWLHGLSVASQMIGKWRVPEDNVQSLMLWRQRSGGPVVGVGYLDENEHGCASLYRFTNQQWQLLRDFCDDHSQVDVLYWNVWNKTLHMSATAVSGSLIPNEPALVVVPDIDQFQQNVSVIDSNRFEGRIIDSLVTFGGGYFFTVADLPEGCPMAPWICIQEGRLYHFSKKRAPSVSNVFEGHYVSGLLLGVKPLVSQPWPVAERVLFNASTLEQGSDLWRSDGTPEGTYLLNKVIPGSEEAQISWVTNTFIWTAPLSVVQ